MPEKLTLSVSELITQLWVIFYFHKNEMTMKGKAVVSYCCFGERAQLAHGALFCREYFREKETARSLGCIS